MVALAHTFLTAAALTRVVQLCRPGCVKALLECDASRKLLDARDMYGHTALEYAMAMLLR